MFDDPPLYVQPGSLLQLQALQQRSRNQNGFKFSLRNDVRQKIQIFTRTFVY